jgi:hypothetical protein
LAIPDCYTTRATEGFLANDVEISSRVQAQHTSRQVRPGGPRAAPFENKQRAIGRESHTSGEREANKQDFDCIAIGDEHITRIYPSARGNREVLQCF